MAMTNETYLDDTVVKQLIILGVKVLVISTAHHPTKSAVNSRQTNATITTALGSLKEPRSKIVQRWNRCRIQRLTGSDLMQQIPDINETEHHLSLDKRELRLNG